MPPTRRWSDRHADVLARWPVLDEAWARAVETHRTHDDAPPPAAGPIREPGRSITPREAIDRALGITRTDDRDEVGLLPGG